MLDHRHAYTQPFRVREQSEEPDPFEGPDLALASIIWQHLQDHYPGHPWEVRVEHRTGMASIYLQGFSNWGYHIRISELAVDPRSLCLVTKGGGELLERFNLPRSGLDFQTFLAALDKMFCSNPNVRPE